MKRAALFVILLLLTPLVRSQDARCAPENDAIKNAIPGTPMAPLYKARDDCNQRIANTYEVGKIPDPTVKPEYTESRENADGSVTLNVPEILKRDWINIGSDGTVSYEIQYEHFIKYGKSPLGNNTDFDFILKQSTKGPDGSVSRVSLTYAQAICGPGEKIPDRLPISGVKEFYVDKSGMPGAPIDEYFTIDPLHPTMIPLTYQTIGAVVVNKICKSYDSHLKDSVDFE